MGVSTSIIKAEVCPYCNKKPELVDSALVYGKSYGMIYLCSPCKAWVGTHKDTGEPLGRLANKKLRHMKKLAHSYFDPLWKKGVLKGRKKSEVRYAAYKWLAKELGIEIQYCHIGMFDEDFCQRVIDICKPFYKHKYGKKAKKIR